MPIPDLQTNPTFDGQSVSDSTDWANLSNAFDNTGLLSGCVVSALSPASMGAQVTAGSVAILGTPVGVAAASVTFQAASAFDRRDIIVISDVGAVSVVEGTPCTTAEWSRNSFPGLPPIKPNIPANSVFLADVYIASSTTSITGANIQPNRTIISLTSVAGVASFNTRSGAVTLAASDVESTFGAIGQIFVGTSNGTGELLSAGSVSGTVLTSGGSSAVPSWQAASVNSAAIETTFNTAGQLYVGTGAGTGELLAVGSVGTVLTSVGSATTPTWQAPTGGGGASAGVSSFNTRSGIVTLEASDIEGTFTTPGQIYVGTGSGLGELLTAGSVGSVLTSNGAASIPSWQAGGQTVTAAAIESTFTTAGQQYVGTGSGTGELLAAGSVGTIYVGHGTTSVPSWQSHSAAIESTFTSAGQIYVGTGSGTGELLTAGSVGTVLYSNGASSVPSWTPAGSGNMNTTTYDPAGIAQQVVGTTATQTITNKRYTRRILQTSGPGATPTLDTDNYDGALFTALAANVTSFSTNLTGTPVIGDQLTISLVDNGTARTLAWGAKFASGPATLPTTTTASTLMTNIFFWNSLSDVWLCMASG